MTDVSPPNAVPPAQRPGRALLVPTRRRRRDDPSVAQHLAAFGSNPDDRPDDSAEDDDEEPHQLLAAGSAELHVGDLRHLDNDHDPEHDSANPEQGEQEWDPREITERSEERRVGKECRPRWSPY